jgi:ribonuclease H2 subunit A
MLRRTKYNLNALSHDCAIGLVKLAIERGANITEVFVDTFHTPSDLGQVLSQLHQFLASMALNEHNLVMVILE